MENISHSSRLFIVLGDERYSASVHASHDHHCLCKYTVLKLQAQAVQVFIAHVHFTRYLGVGKETPTKIGPWGFPKQAARVTRATLRTPGHVPADFRR
ncbi:unnamed protein product [Ascophyllum nodosum]